MNWLKILALSGTLLLGILIGKWSHQIPQQNQIEGFRDHGDPRSRSPISPYPSSPATLVRSRERDQPANSHSETITLTREKLAALAELSDTRAPGDEFFEGDEKLSEILNLSTTELDKVQREWVASVETLRTAEANTLRVEIEEGVTVLRVDGLAELRNKLRTEFTAELVNLLGPDRCHTLLAFKGGEALFGDFEEERTYRIAPDDGDEGGFLIEEINGDQKRVWISEQIPFELRHLVQHTGLRE